MRSTFVELLVVCLIISQLSACGGGGGGGGDAAQTGSLQISVYGAQVDGLQEVVVQFTAVTLRPAAGPPQRFEFAVPRDINIKALTNGQIEQLLDTAVPVGDYESLVLEVNAKPDAVFDSYVLDGLGGQFELDVPAERIELSYPFSLSVSEKLVLVTDWNLRISLSGPGAQGSYDLEPSAVRIIDNAVAGSIAGVVSPSLLLPANPDCSADDLRSGAGSQVYVYAGFDVKPDDVDEIAADPLSIVDVRLSNATGKQEYTADFLAPGDYTLAFTCQAGRDQLPASSIAGANVDDLILFTPGVNVLVMAGEISSADFAVLPKLPPTTGPITAFTVVNYFDTGFSDLSTPLTVPLIDPAGIVYYPPAERLIIADSEINEVAAAFSIVQANLMSTAADGSLVYSKWDLTQITGNEPFRNREPTGVAYCENDDHFYITNDDLKLIYRYSFDGSQFIAVDSYDTSAYQGDPEGISCDPDTGRLYVVGGVDPTILILSYKNGFVVEGFLDLPLTAGNSVGIPGDVEGIAFDQGSGNLYLVAGDDKKIFAYTADGEWLTTFSIEDLRPRPVNPQGLSIGPSTDNPYTTSFYIADGLVDNDLDGNAAGSGRIYEARISRD